MSDLLSELGLDPEDVTWRDLALCKGNDTEYFYNDYEKDAETAQAIDQMCLHCPVIARCFFEGAKNEHGVWGGVYWNGSGKPDKNKNSHKSEDVWAAIHQKVSEYDPEDD